MTALGVLVLAAIAALLFAAGYGVIRLNRRQRVSMGERRELLADAAELPRADRRAEDYLTVVAAAVATAWLLFDVGGLAVPIIAFVAIAFLQIGGQRAHNSARAAAIADYRRVRRELSNDERQRRLEVIRVVYGRKHPAVRRLAAEEERERSSA
jgi:hypothetical protein